MLKRETVDERNDRSKAIVDVAKRACDGNQDQMIGFLAVWVEQLERSERERAIPPSSA